MMIDGDHRRVFGYINGPREARNIPFIKTDPRVVSVIHTFWNGLSDADRVLIIADLSCDTTYTDITLAEEIEGRCPDSWAVAVAKTRLGVRG